MNEATNVLERLERIRELDRRRAPAAELLEELRALVGEAEDWARVEGDARARAAADDLDGAVQNTAVQNTAVQNTAVQNTAVQNTGEVMPLGPA